MKTNIHTATEKQIGDFCVTVESDNSANGPYAVRVHGGPNTRTLACRFQSEQDACDYLARVSSRTLIRAGL